MSVTRRYDATLYVGRREFLMLGAGTFLSVVASWGQATPQSPDSLPGTGPSGRLWDPARAGRPLEPVTAADNDAAIQAIEKQLHCTCGCNLDVYTCRTTDFTCTVSPAMHQHVIGLAERNDRAADRRPVRARARRRDSHGAAQAWVQLGGLLREIGRASCRERV